MFFVQYNAQKKIILHNLKREITFKTQERKK